ncbi:MAG: phosphatidate cytidylyltransferase [Bacteroidales bacterium]|nr:phosphatidate cytidylyltransferase [Bacteroidales bacterium]MBN2755827.1 phosphatidate cytidylyltransferase [Bacteroidales bacterium]
MKNNFAQRVITAIIFAIILIGGVFWNPISFFLVFLTVVIVGIYEFFKLSVKGGIKPQIIPGILLGIVIYLSNFLVASSYCEQKIFTAYIPLMILIIINELYREKAKPFTNIAFTIFGAFYVAVPFGLLSYFVFEPIFSENYMPYILLGYFFLIWSSDSGAYIVGSLIGKHKLFERISPKKTWEGFFGGAAFSLLAAYILSLFIKQVSLVDWIVISLLTVVFGTFGDLVESLLKRMVDVKDSGHILPGHGGILDRFDSILISAPIIFIYLLYVLN